MTSKTNVILEHHDADHTTGPPSSSNEWFNLKVEEVEVSVGNSLIVRAILSASGDLAGADPVLNSEKYQVMGISLLDVDSGDYPDSLVPSGIPSSDHNQRMEAALRSAAKEWGPSLPNKIDTLYWNDQSIPIVITSYSARESGTDPRPGTFTADLELTHIDAYVG